MSSSASKIPSASTLIEEFKRTCGSTTELDQTEAAVLCLWLIWQTNHAAEKTTQGVSTRYARVSTGDRDTAVQVSVLKTSGCERIYWEKASGGRWDRIGLSFTGCSTNFARVMARSLEARPAVSFAVNSSSKASASSNASSLHRID